MIKNIIPAHTTQSQQRAPSNAPITNPTEKSIDNTIPRNGRPQRPPQNKVRGYSSSPIMRKSNTSTPSNFQSNPTSVIYLHPPSNEGPARPARRNRPKELEVAAKQPSIPRPMRTI